MSPLQSYGTSGLNVVINGIGSSFPSPSLDVSVSRSYGRNEPRYMCSFLYDCISACLYRWIYVCLSVYLSVCLSVFLPVCPTFYLCLRL